MSKLGKINEDYKDMLSIKTLISTYQEIASLRMRAVRDYVMQNRQYFDGINKIYNLVINSYKSELIAQSKSGKYRFDAKQNRMLNRRNGKTLYVLLSANSSLYGKIVQETFYTFLNDIKETPEAQEAHVLIVGKVGKALMEQFNPSRKFEYFELADTLDDVDNIKRVQEKILQYETVIVYHGVFDSILKQSPRGTYITGASGSDLAVNTNVHYMFEPNLQEVLLYFENQILASSFIQSLNESYLSKYASRMVSLDVALSDIERKVKNISLTRQKVRHSVNNRKQQDLLAGRQLWTK